MRRREEGAGGIGAGLVVSLLAVGCATPNSVVYTAVNQPSRALRQRSPESVDVYLGKPPSRPHVEVGLFEIYQGREDDGSGRSTEDMFRSLRLHSALRGCDAVQMLGVEIAGKSMYRVLRAVCDIYTDEEGRRAAATLIPRNLPGQGAPCSLMPHHDPAKSCPDPWICQDQVCVSPYR
jgi:hypothetical protein